MPYDGMAYAPERPKPPPGRGQGKGRGVTKPPLRKRRRPRG